MWKVPGMGHTVAEKILARASGSDDVSPGEYVICDIDVAVSPDSTVNVAHVLDEKV